MANYNIYEIYAAIEKLFISNINEVEFNNDDGYEDAFILIKKGVRHQVCKRHGYLTDDIICQDGVTIMIEMNKKLYDTIEKAWERMCEREFKEKERKIIQEFEEEFNKLNLMEKYF